VKRLKEKCLYCNGGHTIFQLVLALLLFAILGNLATLSVQRMLKANELSRVSDEILHVLDGAWQIGQATGVDINVSFESNSKSFHISEASAISGKRAFSKYYHLPKSIMLETANFASSQANPNTLIMRSNGTATAGRFVLKNSSNETCHIIQALRGARRKECFL
jgi:hypothetical protein